MDVITQSAPTGLYSGLTMGITMRNAYPDGPDVFVAPIVFTTIALQYSPETGRADKAAFSPDFISNIMSVKSRWILASVYSTFQSQRDVMAVKGQ